MSLPRGQPAPCSKGEAKINHQLLCDRAQWKGMVIIMKNSIEITRAYQIRYMILHHLIAVAICGVFEAVAAWYFLDKQIARYVVAGIFAVIYGLLIYSSARKLSLLDNKPYTPLRPHIKWGVIWGLAIAATVAVFTLIYKLNWIMFSQDGGMTNIFSVILNILYYVWTAPYFGFMPDFGGNIPAYTVVIMFAVPVIASTLGYWAGIRKFDLLEKLDSLTFEKEEDDD